MNAFTKPRLPTHVMRTRVIQYALLTVMAALVLTPLLLSLSVALQGDTVAPRVIPDFSRLDFDIFRRVFEIEPNLPRWIVNSFVVATVTMISVMLTSSLTAYALAMPGFGLKKWVFFFCLGTLMIPFEATIIPNFLFVSGLGWRDSYQGLIAPFLASGFGIFLLRQYFLRIPRELYEAAQLDGCSRFGYLWRILLPLSGPALSTLGVYSFLGAYNAYYWPLLISDNTAWRTTQVGITVFRNIEYQFFNTQMAANLIVMLPTLILLVAGQQQLVRGLTAGALKG